MEARKKIKYYADGFRIHVITKKGERESYMFDTENTSLWFIDMKKHNWAHYSLEKVYTAEMDF